MLDQSWSGTSDINKSRNDQRCAITTPRHPGRFQTVYKKSTVKELIMRRRICGHSEQKWISSQEKKILQLKCEPTKPERTYDDIIAMEPGPTLTSAQTPTNPGVTNHFLPGSDSGHVTQQHAPQRFAAPFADGKIKTFFQWQIVQEANGIEGIQPEMLDRQDEDGDTFLHIAVAHGKRALAYVLAGKMARIGSLDVKEHNGQTALHIAVATNQHLIVQDLLLHGAQINARDCWGRSALHVCAEKGLVLALQSIQMELTGRWHSIDIEMFNYDGLTPLHVAVLSHNALLKEFWGLANPRSFMAMELTQRRLKYGQCIRTLLLMGACCGTKDRKSGRTSLHIAAEEANLELFRLFLDQPTSLSIVNLKTFSGNTALHVVSALQNRKTQVEVAKLLMRHGADRAAKNLENDLPAQLVPEGPMGDKLRRMLKGRDVQA